MPDPARPVERPCIRTVHLDAFTVIEAGGELDLTAVPDIRRHLDSATARSACHLIVDLRPARFFDCSALNLLHRARLLAREGGGTFALVCTDRWHLRVLRLAGLSEERPPAATLRQVLSAHWHSAATDGGSVSHLPSSSPGTPSIEARSPVLGAKHSRRP
ncbi:STAS domain-containing protein [Streptomyces sp. NPDC048442]|uniref:STAS domain-containing protein n=1 Tax=Streptomyces sp. NPDC048442 TaxID=3154823 RepID=UPI0034245D35